MTRVGGPATNAAAFAQTSVTEQNLTKTRLRKNRLRKAAAMRAMQRRELERARQLREHALAKRGIAKFSVSKAAKERARPNAHPEHSKLPSLRKREHEHHDTVERRQDREQGRGRQQGDGQSNQQQQQQQQQQEQQEQRRDQQDLRLGGPEGGAARRRSMRITARAGATAAVAPHVDVIGKALAGHGDDIEQAEQKAKRCYFDECDRIGDEARRAPASPRRSPDAFADQQYVNLVWPLVYLLGPFRTEQQQRKGVNRIQSVLAMTGGRPVSGKPPTASQPSGVTQQILATRLSLLLAERDHGIHPYSDFDEVKAHLSAKSEADAKR